MEVSQKKYEPALAPCPYLWATKRLPKIQPKHLVSDKAPALYQTSLNKPDELLSNASGPLRNL